jgi:hypothetical protein
MKEQRALIYGSVVEFVENYLSLVYRRKVVDEGRVWCPEWWKHTEAVIRFDALWRSWERYRLGGDTGMSLWFLDHADAHMSVLFDPKGPFAACSIHHGHSDRAWPLPSKSPPPEYFSPAD